MASGYFVNVVPKNPNEDIVSRRDRDREDKPPRSRIRDHWYVRILLNNISPLLLMLMLLVGTTGGAIFLAFHVFSDGDAGGEAAFAAGDGGDFAPVADGFTPLLPRDEDDCWRGAELTYAEASHAVRFGRPLYLGDSCRPVIVVTSAGDEVIRELTGLEMSLPSAVPELLRKSDRTWFASGPNGLGAWWRGPVDDTFSGVVRVSRTEWADAQEALLFEVLSDLDQLLVEFNSAPDYETASWAIRVVRETRRLRDLYANSLYSDWTAAPDFYVCSIRVQELADGVASLPCPSELYLEVLFYVWARYGNVIDGLENVATPYHPEYPVVWGLSGEDLDLYVADQWEAISGDLVRYLKALHDLTLVGMDEELPMPALTELVVSGGLALPTALDDVGSEGDPVSPIGPADGG